MGTAMGDYSQYCPDKEKLYKLGFKQGGFLYV